MRRWPTVIIIALLAAVHADLWFGKGNMPYVMGLRITVQDRASGQVVGTRGNAVVTASVRPQPDGTTRVEFKTSGDVDSGLAQRVVAAYNARMGR